MSSFRKPQAIQRQASGSYVNGEWIPGSSTPLNITASVQPAKMEDLINLPVGRRLADFIRLYTSTELLTVGEGAAAQQPDLFDWHGHTYQCDSVGMWQNGIRSHWKCIFVKVSQE
jgi:hypothetical protein